MNIRVLFHSLGQKNNFLLEYKFGKWPSIGSEWKVFVSASPLEHKQAKDVISDAKDLTGYSYTYKKMFKLITIRRLYGK